MKRLARKIVSYSPLSERYSNKENMYHDIYSFLLDLHDNGKITEIIRQFVVYPNSNSMDHLGDLVINNLWRDIQKIFAITQGITLDKLMSSSLIYNYGDEELEHVSPLEQFAFTVNKEIAEAIYPYAREYREDLQLARGAKIKIDDEYF